MHSAARKLHSQRGASLIFALLVFMLCAFAGVAALVSAASNAGRYARLEHDQQHYLSASSAARMLEEELCGKTVKMTLKLQQIYDWWYVPLDAKKDGAPAELQMLYARQVYQFLNKEGDPVALTPTSTGTYSVPSAAICEFYTTDATGTQIPAENSLAAKLLQDYVGKVFLQNDVDATFYSYKNGRGFLQEPPAGYTLGPDVLTDFTDNKYKPCAIDNSKGTAKPTDLAGDKSLTLAITADDPDWEEQLGTVNVSFTANSDYRLHVEVRETHQNTEKLFTTVFELPATVTSDLSTTVTQRTNPVSGPEATDLPDALKSYKDEIGSYGSYVTEFTFTVTVSWPTEGVNVTRTPAAP